MKVIPDLMLHRIERHADSGEAKPHPSFKINEEIRAAMEAEELKIHNASMMLKSASPDAWKIYEEALLILYVEAKKLQDQGFFELVAERVDPQYFAYTKIYALAKTEVLESILSISQVPIDSLKTLPKKTKSNKLIDIFKKYVNWYR